MKNSKIKMGKWTDILMDVNSNNNTSITDIYRRTNITLSHILEMLNELSDMDMITRKSVGRKTIVTITLTGKEMCKLLISIQKIFSRK